MYASVSSTCMHYLNSAFLVPDARIDSCMARVLCVPLPTSRVYLAFVAQVWRPTSFDALRMMMLGLATGMYIAQVTRSVHGSSPPIATPTSARSHDQYMHPPLLLQRMPAVARTVHASSPPIGSRIPSALVDVSWTYLVDYTLIVLDPHALCVVQARD